MKTIYIDSLQIHSNTEDLGFIVDPNIIGLEQPTIRLPSFDKPNVDGSTVPSQLYSGRLITLSGLVYASDILTYMQRRSSLISACSIKKSSSNQILPLTLKFTTMNDLDLQVSVYNRKIDFPFKVIKSGRFKLDLFAPKFYLSSQVQKSAVIYVYTGGGMGCPTPSPTPFNVNASSISVLNNEGNIDAPTQIIITGPVSDPVVVNETNGQLMTLDYNLTTADEFIVIDSELGTALYYADLNTTPLNIRDKISGDFISLIPGDNYVKLSVAGLDTGNIQVFWRDCYSGL